MSNQPEDQIEKDYRRGRTWEEYAKFGLVTLAGLCLLSLLFGGWFLGIKANKFFNENIHQAEASWKATEEGGGQFVQKANDLIDNVGPKLENVVSNLDTTSKNVSVLTEGLSREVPATLRSSQGLMVGLQVNAGTLLATANRQLDQNGKDISGLITHADNGLFGPTGLLPSVKLSMGHLDQSTLLLNRSLERLPTVINDADDVLKGLTKVELNLDGTVTAANTLIGTRIETKQPDGSIYVTGTGLTGIVENVNGASLSGRKKLDSILFPAPCKGFFGCLKRGVSYVATPILEGGRIYLQLKSLPVHLTSPIPTPK